MDRVDVLVAVVVGATSALADAVVVGIALSQRLVRGCPVYRELCNGYLVICPAVRDCIRLAGVGVGRHGGRLVDVG